MRVRSRFFWPALVVLTAAFLLALSVVALADGISADTDALATSAPHANGYTNSQDIGTSNPYDWSVAVTQNGTSADDVFASGSTVAFTVSCAGPSDWTVVCSPLSFNQSAYGVNQPGTVSVTIPSSTTNTGLQSITVDIRAVSDNGESLSPNEGNLSGLNGRVVLHYNITATTPVATNGAPIIDTLGTFSGAEGSDINLTATAHDPNGDPITYSWAVDTTGGDIGISCPITDTDNTDAAASVKCNDDSNAGTFKLTLSVSDDHSHTTSQDTTLEVTNVAPVASANATPFAYNHYTGVATAKFDFADDGTNDTHTPAFTWSAGTPAAASDTESNGAGTATDTATFAPGCYTLTVTGKTTDDDLADSNVQTIVSSYQIDVYSVHFLAPIFDNQRNFAKYGNVLPVKVQVSSSCTGASITSDNLYLSYAKGTADAIIGTDTVADTVSAADGTGGQMRVADGFYIYNFTTKPLTCNTDYALRVWVGSNGGTEILDATLSLKK